MGPMAQDLETMRLPSEGEDTEAWATLYRLLRPIVYSELLRVLPRPFEGAEDLWHDLFLRFMYEPSRLRGIVPGARERYVRVAARHRALNYLRSLARVAAHGHVQQEPSTSFEGLSSTRIDVDKLLESVTEPDRSLLRSRFLDGVSIGEAARRAKLSYAAAATRIFRALAKLREAQQKSAV